MLNIFYALHSCKNFYTINLQHSMCARATRVWLIGLPCLHMQTVQFRVFAINVYKIGLPFTLTLPHDQRRGLLMVFSNENPALDHQSVCLFSQFQLYLIKCLLHLELQRTCSTDSILRLRFYKLFLFTFCPVGVCIDAYVMMCSYVLCLRVNSLITHLQLKKMSVKYQSAYVVITFQLLAMSSITTPNQTISNIRTRYKFFKEKYQRFYRYA